MDGTISLEGRILVSLSCQLCNECQFQSSRYTERCRCSCIPSSEQVHRGLLRIICLSLFTVYITEYWDNRHDQHVAKTCQHVSDTAMLTHDKQIDDRDFNCAPSSWEPFFPASPVKNFEIWRTIRESKEGEVQVTDPSFALKSSSRCKQSALREVHEHRVTLHLHQEIENTVSQTR